jgi:hypothetical protein
MILFIESLSGGGLLPSNDQSLFGLRTDSILSDITSEYEWRPSFARKKGAPNPTEQLPLNQSSILFVCLFPPPRAAIDFKV